MHGSSGARALSAAAPCGKGVAERVNAGRKVVVVPDGSQDNVQDVPAYGAALEDGAGANFLSLDFGAVHQEGSAASHPIPNAITVCKTYSASGSLRGVEQSSPHTHYDNSTSPGHSIGGPFPGCVMRRRAYEIFSGSLDDRPMWPEAVEGLNTATARMKERARMLPGRYFVFSAEENAVLASIDTSYETEGDGRNLK